MRNHGTIDIECIGQSRSGSHNGMFGTHREGMENPFYGHSHSEESIEKMRIANTGKKQSAESIEKMRAKLLGRIPFWLIGKPLSTDHKMKLSLATKGIKQMEEHRRKNSDTHKQRVKDGKCHLGDGTLTVMNLAIRGSLEYKLWREAVYRRDGYKCVWCGEGGGNLEADHIKPFSLFPELRFSVDNGRTLCHKCHTTTDTYLSRAKTHKEEIICQYHLIQTLIYRVMLL